MCLTWLMRDLHKLCQCVVTQAAARHAQAQAIEDKNDASHIPCDTSADNPSIATDDSSVQAEISTLSWVENISNFSISRRQFICNQQNDDELTQLSQYAVSEDESGYQGQCFYWKSGVLMCK